MDTKQNKQLVMQAYQMYMDKNIKGVLGLVDEDVEWVAPESDYIPFAGSFHGRDQVAQFFTKLEQAQDVINFEPKDFIAEGNKVAVTGMATWHVKATGQTYDSPWVHIFTLGDGKIVRFEQHTHTAAAETAYRATPGARRSTDKPLHH